MSLKENRFNKKVLKNAKPIDDTQVILISNCKNDEKYIVKRFLSSYTYLKSKNISLDGIEFIEQKYTEFHKHHSLLMMVTSILLSQFILKCF